MKRLEIKNWDTSDKILKWDYHTGLRIVMPAIDNQRIGGAYQYRFVDKHRALKLTINISRLPNAQQKYLIRGKSAEGKYSNIHSIGYHQISNVGHVRYIFNEIINELC
jgi:hypothetical protein